MTVLQLLCGLALLSLAGCQSDGGKPNASNPEQGVEGIVEQRIEPSLTGDGINPEFGEANFHHVAQADAASPKKNLLVLYMVGSIANPNEGLDISRHAAGLGYDVLNIQYPNRTVVGVVCGGQDECYRQYRGETLFGQNISYASGSPAYNETINNVDLANSVVNRVVSLLAYLANSAPSENNPDPQHWRQYFYADAASPYSVVGEGAIYPDWDKIVVAGHSQGGGMAAMLGAVLPQNSPLRRVIMFSSPNDNTGGINGNEPANWMLSSFSTPMSRYWGIRHVNDSTLGPRVEQNWQRMGGPGSGGVGGANNQEIDIEDGTADPQGAQRLRITAGVGGSTRSHSSTVDPEILPTIEQAWDYLFTAGGQD